MAILLLCLVPSACGVAEYESYETQDCTNEIIIMSENAGADVLNQTDIEQVAELLNHDLLRTSSLTSAYWVEEMMQTAICDHAESVKEPFAAVMNEDSVIPSELVVLLEEALYHSSSLDIREKNSSYYRTLAELGANEYEMSLEEIIAAFPEVDAIKEQVKTEYAVFAFLYEQMDAPQEIDNMFYFEGNRYLFVYKSGGSNGVRSLCLTEYTDGRFSVLMDFEIEDNGDGKLIKYGKDFYFIFLQCTHNSLQDFDGIRIYKIGENAMTDNLQIRYLPKEYIWERQGWAFDFPSLESYINFLKDKIVSKEHRYLDMGYDKYMTISGDEVEVTNLQTDNLEYPSRKIYQADIANLGIPVYMQMVGAWEAKRDYGVNFYLKDPQTNMLLELDQLSIKKDNTSCLRMVDVWFKVVDNKTLTFSMYYVSDYSYMLNIVLLEGGEVKPLEAWLLLPKKEFVLIEGEVFTTAG